MTKLPIPKSVQAAQFHTEHVTYHERQAAEHRARGETEIGARHLTATEAHRAAAERPLDQRLTGLALRASAIADEFSQRARKVRR